MTAAAPRRVTVIITEEMLDLFGQCLQLIADGYGVPGDPRPEHIRFVQLSRRLEWELIGLPPHAVSIFDDEIDGPPSSYLKPSHAMFIDWPLVQSWRRALQAALDARRGKAR